MKIRSPFKDYYDFCVGKYGIDPKVIYVRVCAFLNVNNEWDSLGGYKQEFPDNYQFYVFHICGVMYCVYRYMDKFYHGPECEAIPDTFNKMDGFHSFDITDDKICSGIGDKKKYTRWLNRDPEIHLKPSKLNAKYTLPVLMHEDNEKNPTVFKDVKLANFGFGRIIEPEKMWIDITNFLLREEPVVNKQTDKEKVVSHGFDLKTSFRKM